MSSSCLVKKKENYLFFQPIVILNNACHHHISTLHVESDLSCRFILENSYPELNQCETLTGHTNLIHRT